MIMNIAFYNRSQEIEQLKKLFREKTLNKNCFACLISGQKNSGKSKVIAQFISEITNDLTISSQLSGFDVTKNVIEFQCNLKQQQEPYGAFIDVTNKILQTQKLRLILSKVLRIVLAIFGINDAISALTDLAETIKSQKKYDHSSVERKQFNRYKKFLQNLTRKTPIIFILKDIQYIDTYSLKLVESIMYNPHGFCGAFIFELNENQGDNDEAIAAAYNLIQKGLIERIHLIPLERNFPSLMLAPEFGETFFIPEENDLLYTVSKGLPGNLVDLIQNCIRSGLISKVDGKWVKAKDFKEKIQPLEQQLIDLLILFYVDKTISEAEMSIVKKMAQGWGLSQEYVDFCIKMLSSIVGLNYRIEKALPWGFLSEYVFLVENAKGGHKIVEYLPIGENKLPPPRNKTVKHLNLVEASIIRHGDDAILIEWSYLEGRRMREIMIEQNVLHLGNCIKLVKEVIEGLRELHKFNIIHSYITPEAVIESEGKYLLATLDRDILGLLRNYGLTLYSDSIYYSAPELLRDGKSSVRSDIYSLGILLFRLITSTLPFIDLNPKNAKDQIIENRLNFVGLRGYDNYDSLTSFFERCLHKNPSERFSDIEELLAGLTRIQEEMTSTNQKTKAKPEQELSSSGRQNSTSKGYLKKGVLAVAVCLVVFSLYYFSDEIRSFFRTTKEIEQIVVEISPGATNFNKESPMIHEEIEYLIQEKLVRSGNVTVLSGEQFQALRETETRMEYVPNILIKGELTRSSAGYELAIKFIKGENSIFDTTISFNEPATFLTTILAPLTKKILVAKKTRMEKDIAVCANWDALTSYLKGRNAWLKMDKTEAIKELGKAIHYDPGFTLAKLKLLEVLKFEGGNTGKVNDLLTEIKLSISNLSYIDSIRVLANEKSINGLFLNAIPYYQQIAEKLPHDKYSYYEIAETYYTMCENDKAIEYYQKALARDTNFALAYNHLGYSYLNKYESEKALTYFRRYLQIDSSANAFDSMGDGFFAAGMIDSALFYKKKGIELDPGLEYLQSGAGILLTLKGEYKKASYYFERYDSLVKGKEELEMIGVSNKAFKKYVEGDFEAAEKLIDGSLNIISTYPSILGYQENYWIKGLLLFEKGDYRGMNQIIEIFTKTIKKYNFSNENYNPVFKFYLHLKMLNAIAIQNSKEMQQCIEILNSQIRDKVKDHGSVFDHAFLSHHLYRVFSSPKYQNKKEADKARKNAVTGNKFYKI
ncbi:hypothetical protein MASR2M39_26080 [Ignavibacteriales bacterium]